MEFFNTKDKDLSEKLSSMSIEEALRIYRNNDLTLNQEPRGSATKIVSLSAAVNTQKAFSEPDTQLPPPHLKKVKFFIFTKMLAGIMLSILLVSTLAVGFVLAGSLFNKWEVMVVLSDSMSPVIKAGDGLVTIPTNSNDLKVGDIVVLKPPNNEVKGLVVHRITAIPSRSPTTIVTKGDSNKRPDAWTPLVLNETDKVSKVYKVIPYAGWGVEFLSYNSIKLVVIGAILILLSVVYITTYKIKIRQK